MRLRSWAAVIILATAPVVAAAGALEVCGDPSAAAGDVARQCRNALANDLLSRTEQLAAEVNLGGALTDLGQADLALEAFDRAAAIDLTRVEIYIGRARAHEALGDRRAAALDWDRALGLSQESVDLRLGRGAFYLRGADPARALEEFSAALAIAPDDPDALYNRGVTWIVLNQPEEAARDLSALIALAPDDAGALYHRARALTGRDDARALADFDRASALAPEWAEPWYLSGRLLDRLGRAEEANRRLRRAFELGFRDPWLLNRIRQLGG